MNLLETAPSEVSFEAFSSVVADAFLTWAKPINRVQTWGLSNVPLVQFEESYFDMVFWKHRLL